MSRPTEHGRALAALLSGGWRAGPPPLGVGPAPDVASLALHGGAGGLVWWRLRRGVAADVRPFRDEYREVAMAALRREGEIVAAFRALRSAGVEPVLVKGWSVARHYPDGGLRPLGDIDLCVRPDQESAARAALLAARVSYRAVDLHLGVPDLPDRRWDDLFARTRLAPLGGDEVRVLGDEDLLRLVCLHFVRHVGERPLWLCDVASLLEAAPPSFDWGRCAGGRPHLGAWVRCVLGLARDLLGARVPACVADPPGWLTRSVLDAWGGGHGPFNPIRAAWRLGLGPIRSHVLLQLGSLLARPLQGAVRLSRLFAPREAGLPFDVHRERTF